MGLYDLINGTGGFGSPDPSMPPQAPVPFSQSPVAKAFGMLGNGIGNAYHFITNTGAPPVAPTAAPSAAGVAGFPGSPSGGPAGVPSVPLPQPRPPFNFAPPAQAAAGAPMSLAPPNPGPTAPQQQQQDPGLIGRFVNALRGGSLPQGSSPGPMPGFGNYGDQRQQPGILPRMFADFAGLGKMFGGMGSGSNPFNVTGSFY